MTARTLAGLVWTGGGKAVYGILRLVVLFLLARLLSPANFGVVGAATVVMGFSTIFSQLGMAPAIVQRPVLEPRHEQAAFSASVGFGLLLGAMLWLLAPEIAALFRISAVEPVLRTFAWTFPLAGLAIVAEAVMQRELRFRWLATVEVSSFVVGYGVIGVVLALLGFGVWALVAAEMSKVALYTAILLVVRPPRFTLRPDRQAFAELMYYGSGFTVSKIANYLALQLDNFIVGRWLGAVALGFYGRAYELMAAAPTLLGEPVDKVLFPAMATRQHDLPALASAYRRGVTMMALITLPLSAVMLVLAPDAIPVLLGGKWTPVIVPFQILTLGIFLRTSYRISDVVTRATGAVYRRAWRQAIYMLCVVAGAWWGRQWGITGVAFGVLGALTVNYVLMADLGLRLAHLSWRRFWGAHLHALFSALVTGALVGGLAALLRLWGLPHLAVLVTAGVLGLGGTLLLVRAAPRVFLGDDGLSMFHQVRKMVFRSRASRTGPVPAAPLPPIEPLALVRQLGAALGREGVRYCQWKGHWKRHRWATGAGDIDLLVDRADAKRFAGVLRQLGFIPAVAPRHQRLAGVQSYFGLDRSTGTLVHVHAHERMLMGRAWSAVYPLPVERPYLASATPNSVFRTPAPEFELIGLVLRMVERYRVTTALRPGQPAWLERMQQELSDIEERVDQEKLARALQHVPFLDAGFFERCRQSLRPHYSRWKRVLLRRQLLSRLAAQSAQPSLAIAVEVLARRAGALGGRLLGNGTRKRVARGGTFIAVDGADGAGKTTAVQALRAWLSPEFQCRSFHFGRPRRRLLTLAVGAVLWSKRRWERRFGRSPAPWRNEVDSGRSPGALELLRFICTARDRYLLALKAKRLADSGAVVLCERYPTVTSLAGPSIQQLKYPTPRSRVGRWLVTMECRYYERMPRPDLVTVLVVEPELAVRRKQDEPADYVRRRAELVQAATWNGSGAQVVDANRALPEVVSELKYLIWSALRGTSLPQVGTQPVIVELVGPAGAGKSAVADVLRGREHALRVSIWGLPLRFVCWSAVTLLPTFLALCLGTHSLPWEEMKQMIRLGALRRFLAQAATPDQRLIVLDEGPVFALSWLQVFGDERLAGSAAYQRWVRRTLAAWASVLDVIVRLDAPDPVLAQRIRSRVKPHMVKDQSDQEIAAFAARFRAAFAAVIAAVTSLNGTRQLTVSAEPARPEDLAARVLQGLATLPA